MTADPGAVEKVVGVCAKCGRPFTQRGPGGECLRCLVSLAFPEEPEESVPKHSASRRVTPGRLKYAHFEVEMGQDGFPVELGAGGMAVTYRARDTVLNSIVALKVIDRKVAENSAARSRFLREARAAAKLHHPNVAGVTHYGEQDGECFYVMELVEGETLEDRVRRSGPMPLALALEVTEQAARALAAAEACGVVHRDIKPSNLMIASQQGESNSPDSLSVKVIDYGIAKVIAAEPEIGADQTQAGFIGTPAFASPEQFAAGKTCVDARSDIYSLGVTLWFLLCGRTPFAGRTLEDIRQRQEERLPVAQLKAAHVPAPVAELLKSMLAVNPADRPQSARALLVAVHRCYLRFEPEARSRRTRFGLTMGVSAVLIAAISFGMWRYRRAQFSAAMERSIAVLPFENLSPSHEDAFFTVGMQEEITSDLARIGALKVIGSESTRAYPPKNRNLAKICAELGARHLLEGSIRRENGQVHVGLRLINAQDSEHSWTEHYDRPLTEVFAMQSEITRVIADRLHAEFSKREKAAVDEPPTSDLAAYDLYLRAREGPSLWDNEAGVRRDSERKIALLNQAVARDPSFTLAYCELAKAHGKISFYKSGATAEELSVDHRSLAEVALQKARRLRPDAGELHLAQAFHFLYVTKDLDQAHIETDLARRTLPNNAEVEYIAGRVARRQGRWDDAVRCLTRASTLDPRTKSYPYTLAETYRLLRRYEDYDRAMEQVIAMSTSAQPSRLTVERALGYMMGRADMGPLRTAVAAASVANNFQEEDQDLYGLLFPLWGRDPDGVIRKLDAMKADGVEIAGVQYSKMWFNALAARMRGDASNAQTAFAAARVQAANAVIIDATNPRKLGLLAVIDAGLGRRDEAVSEARRACDLSSKVAIDAPIAACNLAVVYAWTGQVDLAFGILEEWIIRPAGASEPDQPTYGDFRLNPVWDPLRNDPRFVKLVERLAPPKPR